MYKRPTCNYKNRKANPPLLITNAFRSVPSRQGARPERINPFSYSKAIIAWLKIKYYPYKQVQTKNGLNLFVLKLFDVHTE